MKGGILFQAASFKSELRSEAETERQVASEGVCTVYGLRGTVGTVSTLGVCLEAELIDQSQANSPFESLSSLSI